MSSTSWTSASSARWSSCWAPPATSTRTRTRVRAAIGSGRPIALALRTHRRHPAARGRLLLVAGVLTHSRWLGRLLLAGVHAQQRPHAWAGLGLRYMLPAAVSGVCYAQCMEMPCHCALCRMLAAGAVEKAGSGAAAARRPSPQAAGQRCGCARGAPAASSPGLTLRRAGGQRRAPAHLTGAAPRRRQPAGHARRGPVLPGLWHDERGAAVCALCARSRAPAPRGRHASGNNIYN